MGVYFAWGFLALGLVFTGNTLLVINRVEFWTKRNKTAFLTSGVVTIVSFILALACLLATKGGRQ